MAMSLQRDTAVSDQDRSENCGVEAGQMRANIKTKPLTSAKLSNGKCSMMLRYRFTATSVGLNN